MIRMILLSLVLGAAAWRPGHPENAIVVGVLVALVWLLVAGYARLTDARLRVLRSGVCPECCGRLDACECGRRDRDA